MVRSGEADRLLQVFYAVKGTATPAEDYRRLSGFVEFAAGQRAVRILVAPIDDLLPEPDETVAITLIQGPIVETDPDTSLEVVGLYQIGERASAEVVIVDNDDPREPVPAVVTVEVVNPIIFESEDVPNGEGAGVIRLVMLPRLR